MAQYIQKLPAVFQTITEKQFFDATVDQVFSKKDSSYLAGYIGRRDPGSYNPVSDFYLPEPTKNRTWWQLEATSFARNADTTKTDIFFYEDLLNKIEYYGGNTLNQDRLFESKYYSFGPPIDYDMFINYQNYYWVDQGLPTIIISGVMSVDIIGQQTYTTPESATPSGITLTTGMTISLTDDPQYNVPHVVEHMGGCKGIQLVPQFSDFIPGTIFEYLPWDGSIVLSNGRLIENSFWDESTWDTGTQPSAADYITIERGSANRNAWSRTNKWVHIEAINKTIDITGTPFPVNASRALRPIIQFIADLPLYNSGTQFKSEISYGFRGNGAGYHIMLSQTENWPVSILNMVYSIQLNNGDLVCFMEDTSLYTTGEPVNQYIFVTNIRPDGTVFFTPHSSIVNNGDIVIALQDSPYTGTKSGSTWYFSNGVWSPAVNDKVSVNQPPLFQLYNHNGVPLNDVNTYPESTFNGNKIFSYKVNNTPGASPDIVLGFPIVYTSLGQASDIIFENNLITDRYTYSSFMPIDGYYYYKTTDDILYNSWNLYDLCECPDIIPVPPCNCLDISKQRVIDKYPVFNYGTTYTSLPGATSRSIRTVDVLSTDGLSVGMSVSVVSGTGEFSPETVVASVDGPTSFTVSTDILEPITDSAVISGVFKYRFKLSATPFGYPETQNQSPDIIVSVNGTEVKSATQQLYGYTFVSINNSIYVDLTEYLINNIKLAQQTVAPVVEIQTYTHDPLDPASTGYFQIPQQLEANPLQEEVSEISGSNLIQHFSSIISNQIGFNGVAFGGINNYRDTRKNRSVGSYILQNVAPALKSMLVSTPGDLEFINSVRFSQDEYTKFKNKYLSVAKQLIDQSFNPLQYFGNTVNIGAWVNQILTTVNISKEFSNAFAYSYMVAAGTPTYSQTITCPGNSLITLANYVDLNNPKNILYVYEKLETDKEQLLVVGVDYEIVSTNNAIDVQLLGNSVSKTFVFNLYKEPLPTYIPSTPSKLGMYGSYIPTIMWDTSYATPTWVIVGHDGSKTIAYGDYRDQLLLELERRIYNGIQYKFRNEYFLPVRIESVKSGYFRKTRYTREEFLNITESYINKWSAKVQANYRTNDWAVASQSTPVDSLWKLYNYSDAISADTSEKLNLPGNWKGIFQYFYDTYYPNTRPWEMLGFSQQPSWWVGQYGNGIINSSGEIAWPNTLLYSEMWQDLENGIIRQGPSAIYDPVTLTPVPQVQWARPGLSEIIPVDANGDIISVIDLFNISVTGNPYAPFDNFDADWVYGDGGPVEQTWMSTSGYIFSLQEFLYLVRPGPFGELMWETLSTTISPGLFTLPGIVGPVMSSKNWQYVQDDKYGEDEFYTWMRPKNSKQIVHAESVDGSVQVRFGYQTWISDRILFLGKDITETFGQKIRTLDVNLANKLAGFTNKDTTNTYIESVTPGVSNNALIIPSTNFDVILHKSPVIDTYSYSGVIIRALSDGTFVIYGYDLLSSAFTVLDRSNDKLIDITIGGTPAEFQYFNPGSTYKAGDIVRYNSVYYVSLTSQINVQNFSTGSWQKLSALPTVGGVSVTYKPVSSESITKLPYGSILKTPQAVFDFLIGWGAWLETQGWQFQTVSQETNQISDWLSSAKQFLFWLNTNWAPDASIQLSPLANSATLIVRRGYPNDIESLTNGVYSILDKYGMAIAPSSTAVERAGSVVTVSPVDVSDGGIYFLQITASETEHILIFDNTTSFNDVVYSPLLRARQQRLRFNGFRSNGWYGKMEAPGYLIVGNRLVPNYDTMVNDMRYYYDPDYTIDNPGLEALGRHLIGYESKSYLDNLQVSNDIQYLFYQGAIRQKGTKQAFDKLFRSTKIQANEVIEIYEEWALKLGNFGNTIEQVSTEFVLQPEQNIGDVILARLNFVPSTVGFVKEIKILNAETKYVTPPKIIIGSPTSVSVTRQATAYAVLGSDNRISRIDIIDGGAGYTSAPDVSIVSSVTTNPDRLYSVWQGDIVKDETLDNIVEIDIDQPNIWTVRPADPGYSLVFPTTDRVKYAIPNAGYVHFGDVKFSSFDITQTAVQWGTPILNPKEHDTLWIAKNFTEDWCVYKLVKWQLDFSVVEVAGNLFLKTKQIDPLISPQMSVGANIDVTDFGNMIILQGTDPVSAIPTLTNYTVGFQFDQIQTISSADNNNWYQLVNLTGNPISATDIPEYENFTELLLYKTMRFMELPIVSDYSYIEPGDKIWVDQDSTNSWCVYKVSNLLELIPFRKQQPLINTSLFESATVFNEKGTQIAQLPIYDPFKNILPGPAKQNITYMTFLDPATYNVTGDLRNFSTNIKFGPAQVGQLWWDLSNTRFVYYEQPLAIDGSETPTENLIYRRNNWARIFPGSTVSIYEWVKSSVVPSQYTGPGIPRDVTSYVQITSTNPFTNVQETKYYFWVLDSTAKPNIENRTLAAIDVSRLLQSPKSQGYSFFVPVQQTQINNSYMFYNVQNILAYQGNNIQVQYRSAERNDQKHTQWAFFREGDTGSIVSDQFWNKMVDSICGYTGALSADNNYPESISIGNNEVILPVPDPKLSNAEKYGILYRPRQSMFVNLLAARKVFVQSANSLLQHIPIRDTNPGWDQGISDNYWTYTNWYKIGYENVMPTVVYTTLSDANLALSAGELKVGDILQITKGTSDNRYILCAVIQSPTDVTELVLEQVSIQDSAIKLLSTVYTVENRYDLSVELRQLTEAFRTSVMISEYLVDQNELFSSMMNYVLSEQKNPDWVFKSSYIYIKENNTLLSQDRLYIPDQISSIIDYIVDSKPYHTQVRDYTSTHRVLDRATGTAIDTILSNIKLQFGPDYSLGYSIENETNLLDSQAGYDLSQGDVSEPWGTYNWDISPDIIHTVAQFVSRNPVVANFDPDNASMNPEYIAPVPPHNPWPNIYTVPLTTLDLSKKGLSDLYPYTFTFNNLNINNPQTFITPNNIVGIQIGNQLLAQGRDYYVGYNDDETYTVYFYNNPGDQITPVVLAWWDGGQLELVKNYTPRDETVNGINSSDSMVINVDTKLPVNISTGIITPYVGWGEVWDSVDGLIGDLIIEAGGSNDIPWDAARVPSTIDDTISYKENVSSKYGQEFYRNSAEKAGLLELDLQAPTLVDDNVDTIQIFVDPATHPISNDILPAPTPETPGVIWINGERIEYKVKENISPNRWILKLVQRGTKQTAATFHTAGSTVFVEYGNIMPVTSVTDVWNVISLPAAINASSEQSPGMYSRVENNTLGGLWYSGTSEAGYLRSGPGISIE